MSRYSSIQKSQLGMPMSTAKSRLDRIIIFNLAKKLNLLDCYRCNQEILSIKELSVEHKIEWLNKDNASEIYFDIDNIAFSHNICNSGASRYTNHEAPNKGKITHGQSGYRLGCRCEVCKSIYSDLRKDRYNRTGR